MRVGGAFHLLLVCLSPGMGLGRGRGACMTPDGQEKGSEGLTEEPGRWAEMPWQDAAHPRPAATGVWMLPRGPLPRRALHLKVWGTCSWMVLHRVCERVGFIHVCTCCAWEHRARPELLGDLGVG